MNQNPDANFRNKISKCLYNVFGYCKFREECRKKHSSTVCQIKDCDKSCSERHPKQCKFKTRCKFLDKGICAFSHVTLVQNDKTNECFSNHEHKIKDLENIVAINKTESEVIIKSLSDEIRILKKELSENVVYVKDLKRFENENQKLQKEIKNLRNESEIQKSVLQKVLNEVEIKCNKSVNDALEAHKKSVKESVDNSIDQLKTQAFPKDVIEENIIKGYQNDCETILLVHQKFELDDVVCNICEFKSHSQGLLSIHKHEKHKSNDTFETIVEGFKNDIENHIRTLEAMCEDDDVINGMKCDKCKFRNNSEGNLRIHERDVHRKT